MPNWQKEAHDAAVRHGINPGLFVRQIAAESNFNPNARSSAGALGIAQFMPATAAHYGVDPMDPHSALEGAARMMSELYHQYGSYARALSAYNSGKPDAYKDPNFASGQTYNYVKKILGGAHPDLQQSQAPTPTPQPTQRQQQSLTPQATPQDAATTMSDNAAAIRKQAMAGLGDIASGAQQPTDVLHNLPKLVQKITTSPAAATAPPIIEHPQDAGDLDKKAVALAQKYLGYKYTWGGEAPGTGFDCSGLVQYVWKTLGVSVPRTTYTQWDAGQPIDIKHLAPGDAVFFTGSDPMNGKPGHEGLYIGDGKFIEAPGHGKVVRISKLQGRSDYVGARRFG